MNSYLKKENVILHDDLLKCLIHYPELDSSLTNLSVDVSVCTRGGVREIRWVEHIRAI